MYLYITKRGLLDNVIKVNPDLIVRLCLSNFITGVYLKSYNLIRHTMSQPVIIKKL